MTSETTASETHAKQDEPQVTSETPAAAEQAEQTELAAREPAPKPEQLLDQPIELPKEITKEPEAKPTGDIVILETVRQEAESNLTKYLAPKLVGALKEKGVSQEQISALIGDMEVSLHGVLDKNKGGKTDLAIEVTGKEVDNNAALLGELFVAALKEHPQFTGFFAHEPHPHAQTRHDGGIAIHIPHLETALYTSTIQQLNQAAPVANDNKPEPQVSEIAAEGKLQSKEHQLG